MKSFVTAFLFCLSFAATAGITIGTYNIRNFDYDERSHIKTNKTQLLTTLQSLNVDVLSVEEINNTKEFEKFITTKMPGYDVELSRCGGAHGQKLGFIFNTAKVSLLSFNEDLSIADPGRTGACDSGSRPMAIGLFQIKATGQKFYGMTVHLKSGSDVGSVSKRNKQYQIIKSIIQELKSKTGINDFYVAGDFNTTEYVHGGSDYKELTRVVADLGMMDFSQRIPCTAYWWGGSDDGIETPSILDHVIATPGLVKVSNPTGIVHAHCAQVKCQQVPVAQLGENYRGVSDHCPVTAQIQ